MVDLAASADIPLMWKSGEFVTQRARDLGRLSGYLPWVIYSLTATGQGLGSDLWHEHREWILWVAGGTLLAGVPRLLAGRRLLTAEEADLPRAHLQYSLSVYLVAVVWSAFSCLAVIQYPVSWTGLLALLTTLGITAGSVVSFTPDLRVQLTYIAIMTLPSALAMSLSGGSEGVFTGLNAFLFAAFVSRLSLIHHRNYISLLWANHELERARGQLCGSLRQLAEVEERWSLAFEGSGDGVWDWNVQKGEGYTSLRFHELLGLTEQMASPQPEQVLEAVHPDDRPLLRKAWSLHFHGQTPDFHCEARIQAESGAWQWLLIRGKAIQRDAQGHPQRLVGTLSDIQEQKELQIQLAQSRNLESIGVLAAGIAHEINTPLQYVSDNLRFLQESWAELEPVLARVALHKEAVDIDYLREEVPTCLDQSLQGISHMTKIVAAMKDFSHSSLSEKLPVNLNELVETTLTLSRNHWKYTASVETQLMSDLPTLPAVRNELTQVILNLVVNAADAIAERAQLEAEFTGLIQIQTRAQDGHLELSVTDNGSGIRPQDQSRVFDPFFTTKAVGKGTGQGLTLCRQTISRHGGSIAFSSKPGQGTTFRVTLPLAV